MSAFFAVMLLLQTRVWDIGPGISAVLVALIGVLAIWIKGKLDGQGKQLDGIHTLANNAYSVATAALAAAKEQGEKNLQRALEAEGREEALKAVIVGKDKAADTLAAGIQAKQLENLKAKEK